jgi:hypothetical protein
MLDFEPRNLCKTGKYGNFFSISSRYTVRNNESAEGKVYTPNVLGLFRCVVVRTIRGDVALGKFVDIVGVSIVLCKAFTGLLQPLRVLLVRRNEADNIYFKKSAKRRN